MFYWSIYIENIIWNARLWPKINGIILFQVSNLGKFLVFSILDTIGASELGIRWAWGGRKSTHFFAWQLLKRDINTSLFTKENVSYVHEGLWSWKLIKHCSESTLKPHQVVKFATTQMSIKKSFSESTYQRKKV